MAAEEPEKDENAEGAEGAEGAEEGGGKKKLIIIIGAAVVLLLGAGAGLYFTGMLDSLLGKKPAAEACVEEKDEHGEVTKPCPAVEEGAEAGHGEEAAEGGHGAAPAEGGGHGGGEANSNFVEIPTMIVNLNSDDGETRFLRLTVQLELENPSQRAAVEAVMPRVVDQFQTYLRELRVKDLRGSSGIYRLQMELLWRVNQAAAPVKVKDVLFQEILIQ